MESDHSNVSSVSSLAHSSSAQNHKHPQQQQHQQNVNEHVEHKPSVFSLSDSPNVQERTQQLQRLQEQDVNAFVEALSVSSLSGDSDVESDHSNVSSVSSLAYSSTAQEQQQQLQEQVQNDSDDIDRLVVSSLTDSTSSGTSHVEYVHSDDNGGEGEQHYEHGQQHLQQHEQQQLEQQQQLQQRKLEQEQQHQHRQHQQPFEQKMQEQQQQNVEEHTQQLQRKYLEQQKMQEQQQQNRDYQQQQHEHEQLNEMKVQQQQKHVQQQQIQQQQRHYEERRHTHQSVGSCFEEIDVECGTSTFDGIYVFTPANVAVNGGKKPEYHFIWRNDWTPCKFLKWMFTYSVKGCSLINRLVKADLKKSTMIVAHPDKSIGHKWYWTALIQFISDISPSGQRRDRDVDCELENWYPSGLQTLLEDAFPIPTVCLLVDLSVSIFGKNDLPHLLLTLHVVLQGQKREESRNMFQLTLELFTQALEITTWQSVIMNGTFFDRLKSWGPTVVQLLWKSACNFFLLHVEHQKPWEMRELSMQNAASYIGYCQCKNKGLPVPIVEPPANFVLSTVSLTKSVEQSSIDGNTYVRFLHGGLVENGALCGTIIYALSILDTKGTFLEAIMKHVNSLSFLSGFETVCLEELSKKKEDLVSTVLIASEESFSLSMSAVVLLSSLLKRSAKRPGGTDESGVIHTVAHLLGIGVVVTGGGQFGKCDETVVELAIVDGTTYWIRESTKRPPQTPLTRRIGQIFGSGDRLRQRTHAQIPNSHKFVDALHGKVMIV